MKKTELSFWLLLWALALYAAAYPFLKPAPVEDIASLADWQIPSKLEALDAADQRKLLKRLAYPVAMPELLPVPDFEQYKDVVEKKKAFFDYLLPFTVLHTVSTFPPSRVISTGVYVGTGSTYAL